MRSANDIDDLEGKFKMAALIAENPIRSSCKPIQQSTRAKEVHICERSKEEQPLNASREANEVQFKLFALFIRPQFTQLLDRIHPLHTELRLLCNRRNVLHRRECCRTRIWIRHVVVEQSQVELHMHSLFEELPRKIQPRLGRVDVLVQIEHEIVRYDRISRREEGDKPLDEMDLSRRQARAKVYQIGREIDLFHSPCIANTILEHLKEDGVPHGTQGKRQTWVKDRAGCMGGHVISVTGRLRRIQGYRVSNSRLRSQKYLPFRDLRPRPSSWQSSSQDANAGSRSS